MRIRAMRRRMGSKALEEWRTSGAAVLDQIEVAYAAVAGPTRRRREATRQLTHAYTLLLSAQFQRFCRDLHAEAYARLLDHHVASPDVRASLFTVLTTGRALDRGNPTSDNIFRDYRFLCPTFWDDVALDSVRTGVRRQALAQLNEWRNAIAHHDFSKLNARSERIALGTVRRWRGVCGGLAQSFDVVTGRSLTRLVGKAPW
jgi:hypothetical protein